MKPILSLSLFFLLGLARLSAIIAEDDDEKMFVFEPYPDVPSGIEINRASCNNQVNTVGDFCDGQPSDFYQFCRVAKETGVLNDLSDPTKSFTVFLPTNQALNSLFTDVLKVNTILVTTLREILRSNIIEEKLDTAELTCKAKPQTTVGPKPQIQCKTDIAGEHHAYIKGKGNRNQKFIPQFLDPATPLTTCNANLFEVDNVVLNKKYTVRT